LASVLGNKKSPILGRFGGIDLESGPKDL